MHAIRFRVGSMLHAPRLLNASTQPTAAVDNSSQPRFANLLPLWQPGWLDYVCVVCLYVHRVHRSTRYLCMMICMPFGSWLDQCCSLVVCSMLLGARRLVYTQFDRASSMQQSDLSVNGLPSPPDSCQQHSSHQGSQSQQFCTVYIRVRVRIICNIYVFSSYEFYLQCHLFARTCVSPAGIRRCCRCTVEYTGMYRCILYIKMARDYVQIILI